MRYAPLYLKRSAIEAEIELWLVGQLQEPPLNGFLKCLNLKTMRSHLVEYVQFKFKLTGQFVR